jgi:hypothetical protein
MATKTFVDEYEYKQLNTDGTAPFEITNTGMAPLLIVASDTKPSTEKMPDYILENGESVSDSDVKSVMWGMAAYGTTTVSSTQAIPGLIPTPRISTSSRLVRDGEEFTVTVEFNMDVTGMSAGSLFLIPLGSWGYTEFNDISPSVYSKTFKFNPGTDGDFEIILDPDYTGSNGEAAVEQKSGGIIHCYNL